MNTRFLFIFVLFACLIGCETARENKQNVTLYVTTGDRIHDFEKQSLAFGSQASSAVITIHTAERFQEMDGFGAAITGSTCFNLLRMKAENRAKFLKETFCPTDGMGYSYVRISIGASDFSLSEYTLWDDKEKAFALTDEEHHYIIPILKEILAINPELKIKGAPWTSPRWMKVNNLTDLQPHISWTGGQLNPAYYQDYADYFVHWIQAFAKEGIRIHSVSPQNEPLHGGNSVSLFMGWEEQRDFLREAMIPKFKAAGLDTKIYVFDHNYNYDNIADQYQYPIRIYESGVTEVAGAAYHNYGGNKSELLRIHAAFPDMELIFSEASIGTWNDGRNLEMRLMADMRELALGTVNNWCRAVIVWNLMLDMERGPNRPGGCRTCFGAVDIDQTNYRDITRNSHYYIIGHLSSVVKPGATRIGSGGYEVDGVVYAAFENIDGTIAFVFLNDGDAKTITVKEGNKMFVHDVPAKSVVSYRWKKG